MSISGDTCSALGTSSPPGLQQVEKVWGQDSAAIITRPPRRRWALGAALEGVGRPGAGGRGHNPAFPGSAGLPPLVPPSPYLNTNVTRSAQGVLVTSAMQRSSEAPSAP